MSCYLYENHRASPTLILLYVLGVLGVLNVLHVLHVLHLLHVLNVLHVLHGRIVGLLGLVLFCILFKALLRSSQALLWPFHAPPRLFIRFFSILPKNQATSRSER